MKVRTKEKLNGSTGVIARDRDHLPLYEEGCVQIVLLDYDTHDKPAKIVVKDFWRVLLKVCPALRNAERVTRASTSAGLYRTDTGEDIPGSSGMHVYIWAEDGSDVERFLTALFERSWLLGYGWIMIAENGKMLERSIIDKTVWKPEGFAFEAPPTLKPPLAQHAERREPVVVEGEVIDTRTACLSLDADERARFDKLVAEAKEEKAPEAARVKAAYDAARIAEQVKRGVPKEKAERQVEAMYREVLLSDTVLLFKDKTLGECTVKDVLDDPERFHGKYCGDPAEPSLPRDKAQVIQRQSDGWPWIKVYSHGFPDSSYSLKYTEEDYAELDAWGKDRANRAEALTAEFMKKREREGDDDNGAGDGSAEAKTETKKKELLKLDGLFLDELQKLPVEQRKWIVEGYILMYQLNGMFGDGATGKDYLLLQLGLAMTCGAQWLGLDVAQGRVLYFTGEDDVDEVRRREERITNHYVTCGGIYEPRPRDFKVFPMMGKNTVLGVWDQKLHQVRPTDVFEALKREVAEFKPLLVIIPNRVDSFSVNQNDDAHAKQCWRMLGSLCTEFGTTILMPGHASLRSMQSGDG